MVAPDKPSLDYSYTAFQQAQGDSSFPGTHLDNDLANLKQSIDETIDFSRTVIREDGALNNGIVTKASLSSGITLGLEAPRPWATATTYEIDDTVSINNNLYICAVEHVSSVFANDLAADRWSLLVEFSVPIAIGAKEVEESNLDDGAVSTRALADGSVTFAKAAASLLAWMTPVGAEIDFSGPIAPPAWVFKDGRALSRVTYGALLAALTATVSGNVSNASPSVSGLTADLRNLGLERAVVEGTGVPPGTTVLSFTATGLTLSQNANANATAAQLRIFPHGAGDGSTTFNIPDDKDRLGVGRGNMGGTAANRITATGNGNPGLDTSRLGAAGGVDRHTLTAAQIPTLTGEAANNGAHAHGYSDSTAASEVNVLTDAGGAPILQGASGVDRTTAGAGAHTHSVTTNNTGGQAHPNVQPSRVVNKIIFTGVV